MEKKIFSKPMRVVFPTNFTSLSALEKQKLEQLPSLIKENQKAIERELGVPLRLEHSSKQTNEATWFIGPAKYNTPLNTLGIKAGKTPEIILDRDRQFLITDADSIAGVFETFSFLRSLPKIKGDRFLVQDCQNVEEAVERIISEVRDSYPSFELRNLDWEQICQKYKNEVFHATEPIAKMQEWLAQLQDSHTWVKPASPWADLPYEVWVEKDKAYFSNVPKNSMAWKIGVRNGFQLIDSNILDWWNRTAATPHSRALVTGVRLLSGPVGTLKKLQALSFEGKIVDWTEEVKSTNWDPLVEWKILSSGTGYLKIKFWLLGKEVEEQIEKAFQAFKEVPRLIVDLRGNRGGNINLALRFRNRFLVESGIVGRIQNTLPDGTLSALEPLFGEVVSREKQWFKPVRFLTNPLTASSSEDALLGLQGLPQVEIFGESSAGASGRMRVLRLLPGWILTISTALTYDLKGRCIEGAGIIVDRKFSLDRTKPQIIDVVLKKADQNW